jgi:hypothetical protein
VRALANVWVRVIYAMWLKQECYQTAMFEACAGYFGHPFAT